VRLASATRLPRLPLIAWWIGVSTWRSTKTTPSSTNPNPTHARATLYSLSSALAAFVTGILVVAPRALLVIVLLVLLWRARRRRQS
jgi:hypothetical protein